VETEGCATNLGGIHTRNMLVLHMENVDQCPCTVQVKVALLVDSNLIDFVCLPKGRILAFMFRGHFGVCVLLNLSLLATLLTSFFLEAVLY
jgi:hypothetical protein